MDDFIKVSNLTKKFQAQNEQIIILDNVTFNIALGQTVAVLGKSGAGKSTLISILAGLDIPTSGEIYVSNKNLALMDEEERAKFRIENVGFIFQNFQLIPTLTAVENVMLPLELKGSNDGFLKAKDYLLKVGLENRSSHYPSQLSGGEQQRVAIARAFVTEPKILFADEPTGNLDQKTGDIIIKLLFDLNKKNNTTMIFVTHDKGLAANCDKTLHLDMGKLNNSLGIS